MKPVTTLLGRLRGRVAELGDTVIDGVLDWNAKRLVDDEIHRADELVRTLRGELDGLKAQRFTTRERRDAIVAKLLEREAQAVAAMQAGHAELAREVAAAIVSLEDERAAEQALLDANIARSAELEAQIQRGENALRRLKHELDLVRASEAVASAEAVFADRAEGGSLGIQTAIESAERLRSRQAAAPTGSSTGPATASGSHDPLDEKLQAAGIAAAASPIDRVLARLGARTHASTAKKPQPRKSPKPRKDAP